MAFQLHTHSDMLSRQTNELVYRATRSSPQVGILTNLTRSPTHTLKLTLKHTEMAFNMNPYTQGGWSQQSYGSAPSVFGALPSLPVSATVPRSMQPDSVTFQFTQFNTTVLNCQVVGPQSRVAYRIVTEPTTPSCTIFKDIESRNIAMVQWQPNATLEIRGVTPRQRIRDWLRLSPDSRFV